MSATQKVSPEQTGRRNAPGTAGINSSFMMA
jgi:hypothetical protein